jgi:hypothetical protein
MCDTTTIKNAVRLENTILNVCGDDAIVVVALMLGRLCKKHYKDVDAAVAIVHAAYDIEAKHTPQA